MRGALPKNSDCALGATVMPAEAGIQAGRLRVAASWIPAFAGMTNAGPT
jgi:hypothetical protein